MNGRGKSPFVVWALVWVLLATAIAPPARAERTRWTPDLKTLAGQIGVQISMLRRHPNFLQLNTQWSYNPLEFLHRVPEIQAQMGEDMADLSFGPSLRLSNTRIGGTDRDYKPEWIAEAKKLLAAEFDRLAIERLVDFVTDLETIRELAEEASVIAAPVVVAAPPPVVANETPSALAPGEAETAATVVAGPPPPPVDPDTAVTAPVVAPDVVATDEPPPRKIDKAKAAEIRKKEVLRLLRLFPLLYDEEGKALYPDKDLDDIGFASKLARLKPSELDNLYNDTYPQHVLDYIKGVADQTKNPQLMHLRDSVTNQFLNRELRPKLKTTAVAVTAGAAETQRVVSLEEIPPIVALIRGTFGVDCSMKSVPFYVLVKGARTFWVRKNKDFDSQPEGYVVVVPVEVNGETVPYVLTVNGQLTTADTQSIIRMVAKSYKTSKIVLVNPDRKAGETHARVDDMNNTDPIRAAVRGYGSKGKAVRVKFPPGWAKMDKIAERLKAEGRTEYSIYYHTSRIADARLVDLGAIEDIDQVEVDCPYERVEKFSEMSLLDRAVMAVQATPRASDAKVKQVLGILDVKKEQLDPAKRFLKVTGTNPLSRADYDILTRTFPNDFNFDAVKYLPPEAKASTLRNLRGLPQIPEEQWRETARETVRELDRKMNSILRVGTKVLAKTDAFRLRILLSRDLGLKDAKLWEMLVEATPSAEVLKELGIPAADATEIHRVLVPRVTKPMTKKGLQAVETHFGKKMTLDDFASLELRPRSAAIAILKGTVPQPEWEEAVKALIDTIDAKLEDMPEADKKRRPEWVRMRLELTQALGHEAEESRVDFFFERKFNTQQMMSYLGVDRDDAAVASEFFKGDPDKPVTPKLLADCNRILKLKTPMGDEIFAKLPLAAAARALPGFKASIGPDRWKAQSARMLPLVEERLAGADFRKGEREELLASYLALVEAIHGRGAELARKIVIQKPGQAVMAAAFDMTPTVAREMQGFVTATAKRPVSADQWDAVAKQFDRPFAVALLKALPTYTQVFSLTEIEGARLKLAPDAMAELRDGLRVTVDAGPVADGETGATGIDAFRAAMILARDDEERSAQLVRATTAAANVTQLRWCLERIKVLAVGTPLYDAVVGQMDSARTGMREVVLEFFADAKKNRPLSEAVVTKAAALLLSGNQEHFAAGFTLLGARGQLTNVRDQIDQAMRAQTNWDRQRPLAMAMLELGDSRGLTFIAEQLAGSKTRATWAAEQIERRKAWLTVETEARAALASSNVPEAKAIIANALFAHGKTVDEYAATLIATDPKEAVRLLGGRPWPADFEAKARAVLRSGGATAVKTAVAETMLAAGKDLEEYAETLLGSRPLDAFRYLGKRDAWPEPFEAKLAAMVDDLAQVKKEDWLAFSSVLGGRKTWSAAVWTAVVRSLKDKRRAEYAFWALSTRPAWPDEHVGDLLYTISEKSLEYLWQRQPLLPIQLTAQLVMHGVGARGHTITPKEAKKGAMRIAGHWICVRSLVNTWQKWRQPYLHKNLPVPGEGGD